jgi:diguanylate cyclase (GGDEF)-like protein
VYFSSALGIAIGALLLIWLLIHRAKRAISTAELRLYELAHVDSVTNIWNRNAFNNYLQTSLANAARSGDWIGILLLDLDNFKSINDTFGHHGGDDLLRMVAARLQGALLADDVLCRLGGDEFAAILRNRADREEALQVASRVADTFSQPFLIESQELYITCSIGISIYPDDASEPSSFVRNADIAMYRAKMQGKNTVQKYSCEMNDHVQKRALIAAGLRRALDREEFSLHFQPKFSLDSMKLTGAEALLRWTSPQLGLVSPGDFIPVAEDCGLIIPIGDWVLRAACAQIGTWMAQGMDVPTISVNLSARQLKVPCLPEHILAIVAASGIPASKLELELTESVLMENIQAYIDGFSLLQERGVSLSIDDFGTGYSSMAYLKRLPLNVIKIDRTFVSDLPHSQNDGQIVSAIIAMAHNLGISVIAEGVEREEQAEFLRNAGCDAAQGFYYGRPVPAEIFEKNFLAATKQLRFPPAKLIQR